MHKTRSNSAKFPCGSCVTECKDSSVQCFKCKVWFHQNCAKLNSSALNALDKHTGLLWVCPPCKSLVDELFSESSDSQTGKAVLESKIVSIAQDLSSLKEKTSMLSDSMLNLNSLIGQKPAPPSGPTNDQSSGSSGSSTSRRFEIRIQGVPECNENSFAKRTEHDESEMSRILHTLGESSSNQVASLFRLGKFVKDARRPRSILVKFTSEWAARKCLAKSHLLKNFEYPIFVSKSLSKEEVIQEKTILKKRYELISAGTHQKAHFKIRNLKLYYKNEIVPLD